MVREICSQYDVLLIADEVMTGFCRTGRMFAVEHWGVVPDMMTLSKGIVSGYLPFGAVAMRGDILDALEGCFMTMGSTEAGNPVCCAVAMKCIDIYTEERIAEHAATIGQHVMERLEAEFLPLPHVGDLSGLGLMLSVGLVKDKKSRALPDPEVNKELTSRGLAEGLYLRVVGGRLCLAPPLMITQKEIDRALDIIYPLIAELELAPGSLSE